jgi:hypothetical protein
MQGKQGHNIQQNDIKHNNTEPKAIKKNDTLQYPIQSQNARNTSNGDRLSTFDLLVKVTFFVKEVNYIFSMKMS